MNINRFKLTINNLRYICQELYKIVKQDVEYELVIRQWSEKRTLSANSQQWVWYGQIADAYGEANTNYVARACKLDFGLSILLKGERFGPMASYTLEKADFWLWPRNKQLEYMDFLPVTSLFDTKEHNQYRDNLQDYYGQLGVNLEYKS